MIALQIPGQSILRETALRRQIPADIFAIRDVIRLSHLHDATTQLIDRWQRMFLRDFRLSSDERSVLHRSIVSLQKILRDPLSGAPLGPKPFLGTDGHTYGNGILVYILAAPAERRHLSPLEPDLEVDFKLSPHPVAGYMVRWLERQGASLYSPAEEIARRALLLDSQRAAQEANKPARERMALLLQERDARNAQINASKKARSAAFGVLFAQKMAQSRQKIEQQVAPLRQIAERQRAKIVEVEAIGQRDGAALDGLMQKLQERGEALAWQNNQDQDRFGQELAVVRGAIEAVAHQDASIRQAIQGEIEAMIREGFSPIAEQIAFDRRNASRQLQQTETEYQERMAPFRASILKLGDQISELEKEKKKLEQIEKQVEESLSQLEQKALVLRKETIETQIAIEKVREKEQVQWYATAATIGFCALINWAMPVDGVFFPDKQGFVFRAAKSI